MTLQQWMTYKKFTQLQMATLLDVSRPYVSLLVNKKREPSLQLVRRIQLASNGEVSARDLIDGEYL